MLVPKVQGASSEIVLAIHLNEIRDPHPRILKKKKKKKKNKK